MVTRVTRVTRGRLYVQPRLVCSAGDSPARERSRNPVARLAVGKETELLESNDKAAERAVSELPGRSASKHIGDLETRDSEAEPSTVWRRQHG